MKRSMSVAAAATFLALSSSIAMSAPGITEGDLNMRSGPGTRYEVITAIPAGAQVEVFDCTNNWCQVTWNGYEGFSSRSYLDIGTDGYSAAPPAAVAEEAPDVDADDEPGYGGASL